jgi:hypothetical protein
MRMVRTAAAIAGLSLLPSLALAQGNASSSGMKDSWYWGINGGAMLFNASVSGAVRPVDVKDWRRYSAEMYFMPSGDGGFVPYIGVGLALNVLQNAAPQGSFVSEESLTEVYTLVDEYSSRASLLASLGGQFNFGRTAFFVQASAMPTRNAFLLPRSQYTLGLEAGIRYNVGSAIEKF